MNGLSVVQLGRGRGDRGEANYLNQPRAGYRKGLVEVMRDQLFVPHVKVKSWLRIVSCETEGTFNNREEIQ
jgi:hypothetical protein